jgi:hypothetical protein
MPSILGIRTHAVVTERASITLDDSLTRPREGSLYFVSREDANLAITTLSLFVAVVATWVSVTAIRRDRADLRVTAEDAAAGNRYLSVVNVGTRPVRIERLIVHRWRFLRRLGDVSPTTGWAMAKSEAAVQEDELPTVIHPASAMILHYGVHGFGDWVTGYRWEILVEDAAGRRYGVRYAPGFNLGPEGF